MFADMTSGFISRTKTPTQSVCNEKSSRSGLRVLLAEKSASARVCYVIVVPNAGDFACCSAVRIKSLVHVNCVNVQEYTK
jgi:hypothetical protein